MFGERFSEENSKYEYLFSVENCVKLLSELRGIATKYNLDVRMVEKAYFKKNLDES